MAQTGFTPISTYYTTTASAVPTAGNLVNGELALNINTADGKLFYKDSAGVVQVLATKSTGTIGGSTTQVQYNNAGALAGSANFVFDGTNVGIGTSSPGNILEVKSSSPAILINGTSSTAFRGVSIRSNGTEIATMFAEPNAGENRITAGFSGFGGFQTLWTNGAERMRIDSSGNVGIGTSSPAAKLQVTTVTNDGTTPSNAWDNKFLAVVPSGTSTGNGIGLSADTATNTGYITAARPGVAWSSIGYRGLNHLFYASGTTEAMRIDSSGNVLIGTTSYGPQTTRLNLKYAGSEIWSVGPTSGSSTFYVATGTTGVFLTSTGTSWSAISDERKKDIIEPIVDATQKVLQLRAVIGKYKTDKAETRRSFLIAQDVRAVLPEAVSEDENGTLAIAYTETIPLLVAAIKELKAEVDALKGTK